MSLIRNEGCCVRSRQRRSLKHAEFRKTSNDSSNSNQLLSDSVGIDTQQLMDKSEQLVRLITHVCSQKLSGIFRTGVAHPRLSEKCCSIHCGPVCGTTAVDDTDSRDLEALKGAAYLQNETTSQDVGVPATAAAACGGWQRNAPPHSREGSLNISCSESEEGGVVVVPSRPSWNLGSDYVIGGSGAGPPNDGQWPLSRRAWSSGGPSCSKPSIRPSAKSVLYALILLVVFISGITESCSSRSTPKPRPASATLRPNVTFPTYACPPAYAAWFCLNGATCFTVKIQDVFLYNCECADGYKGQRCEFKNLDGTYLPAREKTASIAGGACVAIVLVFFVLFAMYVFLHKDREKRRNLENPYCDRKPLSSSGRSDYICTITPVHVTHTKEMVQPNVEIKCPAKLDDPSRDLYLVSGLEPVCLRTCDRSDFPIQVAVNRPHQIVLQNSNSYNVPKYW